MKRVFLTIVTALLLLYLVGCPNPDLDPESSYIIRVTPISATGSEAVSASVSSATEGTTITLTATLGTGRKVTLSAVSVTLTPTVISTSGETATFTMPASDVAVTAIFAYIQIGDTGPAGGIIFYNDTIGFDFDGDLTIQVDEKDLLDGTNDGTVSGDRYLEAAPSDWNGVSDPLAQWGLYGTDTSLTNLADSSADNLSGSVGNGESNTATLITELEIASETDRAAQLCDGYSGGTQTDWFLPSLGELKLMYENIDDIGGFMPGIYWSSSEYSSDYPWAVNISAWYLHLTYKNINFSVRPIRAF